MLHSEQTSQMAQTVWLLQFHLQVLPVLIDSQMTMGIRYSTVGYSDKIYFYRYLSLPLI